VAQERMRIVMGLTVAGAALLACGLMLVLVGTGLRLRSPHDGRGFVHAGEAAAIFGLVFGVGLLVVLVFDLADRVGRGGPGRARERAGSGSASGRLTPPPAPETGRAELPQEPVVEFRLASSYPRPGHPGNGSYPSDAGHASYPSDAGHGWYPGPDDGSDSEVGDTWSPGGSNVWGSGDDWDSSGEGGWSPAEADGWARDGRDGWGPADQADWGHGGQPEWAAGQGAWGAPGEAGWDHGGQPQWVPDGQGGWVGAGQGGWGPAGQGGGSPAGHSGWGSAGQGGWGDRGQPEWAAADQDEWARDGQGGWGPADQGGWGGPGQGGWDHGDQPQWVPDGQGGWALAGQDGWGGPGQGDWDHGQPQWVPDGQGDWAAGGDQDWGFAEPAAGWVEPEPAQDAPPVTNSRPSNDVGGDLDDTSPLPVIRDLSPPTAKTADDEPDPAPEPGQNQSAPFSVFEPAPRKSVFEPGPKKNAPEHDRGSDRHAQPGDAGRRAPADPPPAQSQAKIEQIKDLYVTAEAIGEDALVKHFDQLRHRQRSLIREFFEQAGLGSSRRRSERRGGDSADDGTSSPSGDSTQDGASLPG
jgi:hypothetical protein